MSLGIDRRAGVTAKDLVGVGSTNIAKTDVREIVIMVEAIRIFEGVFLVPDPRNPSKKIVATRNLSPTISVYGESLIKCNFDGCLVEFRSWDPFRSKLSASILKGLKNFPFKENSHCVYLGVSTGTTVSHLSDIVGNGGRIFGVEIAPRVAREFLENVVKRRRNIVPIIEDAKHPERYPSVYGQVDLVYCDIAQQDQTEIAVKNCEEFRVGMLLLVVKASSIDALKSKYQVFREQESILEESRFQVLERIDLEPYDKNHALIVASKSYA